MESLHSDGSATYLLIIWVEIIIPLTMKSKQKPYPSIVFLSKHDASVIIRRNTPTHLGTTTTVFDSTDHVFDSTDYVYIGPDICTM